MKQVFSRILRSKALLIFLALSCLYVFLGFFIIPQALKWYVPKYAKERQFTVNIDKIHINPFLFTIEVLDAVIDSMDEKRIASVRRLVCDFEPLALFTAKALVSQLIIEKPSLHILINRDGSTNLSINRSEKKNDPPSDSSAFVFELKKFTMSEGSIHLVDNRQS